MNSKPISRLIGIAVLVLVGFYIYNNLIGPRTFKVKGEIVGFGTDRKSVIISHEDIPGYMKAMTMPFAVRDTSELTRFKVGETVGFTLHVTSKDAWITNIHSIPDSLVHVNSRNKDMFEDVADTDESSLLQNGDSLPEVSLTDQDGRQVRTNDFRDKVLVLTFFYTSCPLPNYCPLMSNNFREAEKALVKAYGDKVHLLSISFDTKRDTPDVLKEYGRRYDAQFDYWSFATATDPELRKLTSAFGVIYQPVKGTFTHNLRTVVVGPDGRVRKIFPGSQWKPGDLVREVATVVNP
ncbi:MAG TPA: SCO family protein [Balneolales bacterium]|nr:SCO family protein [Balneolales bacterium]